MFLWHSELVSPLLSNYQHIIMDIGIILYNSHPIIIIFFISDEAHNLDFYYEQAQDYPVDLYYLMDLSKSMEDDKEKLSALG